MDTREFIRQVVLDAFNESLADNPTSLPSGTGTMFP
jgi:hypothetical protein